ncbi:aminotransferase-like domain-containing protein [Dactylosporangium cerinum]
MAGEKTNSAADLLVELDRTGGGPLHRQLEASIRAGIRSGRLAPGSALPPSRALAASLGVSRGVVVTAYEQLTAEGYLTSRSGGYTTIATGAAGQVPAPAPPAAPAVTVTFGYGRTDVSQFPRAAWLRSVRRVLTTAPTDRFGYTSGQGAPELRAALAGYLNRVRGTDAHPDTIVICAGYAQAANLLIQVLGEPASRSRTRPRTTTPAPWPPRPACRSSACRSAPTASTSPHCPPWTPTRSC